MEWMVNVGMKSYRIASKGWDISIPMLFDGPQPNTYGVPAATAKVYEGGGFIGDVREGSGCNFETYTLTPHCNGTHTEGVGHISKERISVLKSVGNEMLTAQLITVYPHIAAKTKDSYDPGLDRADKVIDSSMLEQPLKKVKLQELKALIIRTEPNDESKKSRDYMVDGFAPPFFTLEAMELIRESGVKHLLVDMPSVDRLRDEGKLSAHHIFWQVQQGSHDVNPDAHSLKTITEFIFVPDEVRDGLYLLNLQVAPFVSDAAPSRPVLFPLIEL